MERAASSGDAHPVADAAAAAGATDVLVFRRVTGERFVHVGGLGRGESWAGNVDLILDDEPRAQEAISGGTLIVVRGAQPLHILGPYYQRCAALVPVSADLLIVFGSADALTTDANVLSRSAEAAAGAISQVSAAKRLADELELLHAVHSLAQTEVKGLREVMSHVAASALAALSCDLGAVYMSELDAVEVAVHDGEPPAGEFLLPAMRSLFAERAGLPSCVQDSALEPPPAPLPSCGVTSHYVLPIGTPPFAVLALFHTETRPRGFTSLCRQVGLRMAESAEPLLRSALTLHELEAELERVGRDARMDPLTKLPNRLAWEEAIEERAPVTGGVIVLDVDALKTVNDERGHHAGDEYLQLVAATVSSSLREDDFIARVGGDEFVVLLPGADELVCHSVARRIREALDAHPGLDGFGLAASVGHAAIPPGGSIADAVRLADEGMYETKRADRRQRRAS